MTLGEKIYKNRTRLDLSQGDLADMLEVSRQSVSKWENDAAVPDLDKIIKLSEIFGMTIDELVKGEAEIEKAAPTAEVCPIKEERQNPFPPRKIIGTVLLSLSLIVTFICFAIAGLSGALSGIILSSPLILSGIVCFVFKKNVGLWCSWAVFFAVDMYLRFATGTSSGIILNFQSLLFYIRGGDFIRIMLAFAQFAVLVSLILMTVLRFRKIPLESKKIPAVFWGIYGFLRLFMFFFVSSDFYREIFHKILANYQTWIFTLFSSLYSWLCAGIFVAAASFTVRWFYSKKH